MTYLRNIALVLCSAVLSVGLLTGSAKGQTSQVAFGSLKQDPDLPVEVTAETLNVNQLDGTAVFSGNVVVIQGEMRLAAAEVLVIYSEEESAIKRLIATGDVVLVSGPDQAEAERADYEIESGTVVMTENVLLTQGPTAVSGDKMTVNLNTGTAEMIGRVKTVFQSDKK
ncbi:MAG: lipopolysaccharide transport periplasmic protein LptA [Roseibium sp.]